MTGTDEWLVPLARSSGALTLVCVPYAGGRPGVFVPLARGLDGVDVLAVQLPGHGARLREKPLTSVAAIVPGLAAAVAEQVRGPYIVLGHSMGGLVGVELVRALQEERGPEHFIVSACRAPSELEQGQNWYRLPDDDLVAALVSLGADPVPLAIQELRDFALPVLRADLEVVESFDCGVRPKLRCPVTAISGTEDPDAMPELMLDWEREAGGGFRTKAISGGHFLLEERPAEMLHAVRDVLDGC
ncbi:alpha/beta fold hydrolase [Actinomadura sp. DC4]|uniref:thioesterase II family protein n=1 Tax=Actinomadura sp. DC4 TaxID=3055069 RepID=UPI0025B0CDAB|nr:alpha/beta fold hydrolase [Actinomadura sp. DC4]MDN3354618.1 alpha/beta fold hydrolase [Actinomadura sp. DC4]